jgi:multidrug resistance efflux pump
MMRRRIGRPGLVGTMARTAVVAGTATAVVGGMNRRQDTKAQAAADQQDAQQAAYEAQAEVAEMQQQMAAMQAQQAAAQPAPAPATAAPAAGGDDLNSQLERLSGLHQSGVLSDDEFAAAKAKLLGL